MNPSRIVAAVVVGLAILGVALGLVSLVLLPGCTVSDPNEDRSSVDFGLDAP